ncbi:hypothetical protein C9374_003844 [Naegleria lovaniensis]|uniref:Vacuolar ATP synthase subunit D n=1 Tax=Naegleria lovaniensis TaxID=51637 RepID=A0AA88H3R5_NAELO|nr:uncharacterized protein C9374_003844 [Naegleria lovaniensis]KAG2394080.1 hypothetical protein C9374_003844 [Naegleria lovaniensis]
MSNQSNNRLPVLPSRLSLEQMQKRLELVKKGHSLLKQKSQGLTDKFQATLKEIKECKENLPNLFRTSFFSLTEAKYAAGGDISLAVMASIRKSASRVQVNMENVLGCQIPQFEKEQPCIALSKPEDRNKTKNRPIISRGCFEIENCKNVFHQTLEKLIVLASLQSRFLILDRTIKATNRRMNAIQMVVQPKIQNTIAYVLEELAEQEREEFCRLKRIKTKKLKDAKLKAKLKLSQNHAMVRR